MGKASYDEAKAAAEARRQVAISNAHEAFRQALAAENTTHAARYKAARDAFDAGKANPEATPEELRDLANAFDAAANPADHGEARAELDRAVRAADAAYHAEIARIGAEHGVTMR